MGLSAFEWAGIFIAGALLIIALIVACVVYCSGKRSEGRVGQMGHLNTGLQELLYTDAEDHDHGQSRASSMAMRTSPPDNRLYVSGNSYMSGGHRDRHDTETYDELWGPGSSFSGANDGGGGGEQAAGERSWTLNGDKSMDLPRAEQGPAY